MANAWFWGSVAFLAFGWGMWSGWSRSFPFDLARGAVKTGLAAFAPSSDPAATFRSMFEWDVQGVPLDSLQARRVRFAKVGTSLGGSVLAVGGWGRWDEHCPEAGACSAVEFSPRAAVVRAWPFDPRALLQAPNVARSPGGHEVALGVESASALNVSGVARFKNGDLLAVLLYQVGHFPPYQGMARIDGAGRVLWTRRDWSHHEPLVSAGDTVWVAGLKLAESPVRVPPFVDFACPQKILADVIRVVDGDGGLVKEVPLLDIVANSPWAPVLQRPPQPCTPFHLNSIAFLQDDISGLADGLPGDLVLSMRNLSAFAVVGRGDHELKRYVRGSFHMQHSVRHLGGSKFIMFDNRTTLVAAPPEASRVLVVDVATGEETILFPKDSSRFRDWYSSINGSLSLSPGGDRVLASYSRIGRAVEIRLEDGAVLAEFDDLHMIPQEGRASPQGQGVARSLWSQYLYVDERRQ